jgi:hypothetical protein
MIVTNLVFKLHMHNIIGLKMKDLCRSMSLSVKVM